MDKGDYEPGGSVHSEAEALQSSDQVLLLEPRHPIPAAAANPNSRRSGCVVDQRMFSADASVTKGRDRRVTVEGTGREAVQRTRRQPGLPRRAAHLGLGRHD